MLALIFDLDGTLVDTVYAHVYAWQRALLEIDLPVDGWRIHRRIGMSGGLFSRAVAREIGRSLTDEESEALQRRHGEIFREILPERRPLPGAVELLTVLRRADIPFGIATSGRRPRSTSRCLPSACRPTWSWSSAATSCAPNPSPTFSSPASNGSAFRSTSVTSSATRSGTSWRHGGLGCSASACSAAAMGRTSCARPVRSVSTATRRSCSNHSTSWIRHRSGLTS